MHAGLGQQAPTTACARPDVHQFFSSKDMCPLQSTLTSMNGNCVPDPANTALVDEVEEASSQEESVQLEALQSQQVLLGQGQNNLQGVKDTTFR